MRIVHDNQSFLGFYHAAFYARPRHFAKVLSRWNWRGRAIGVEWADVQRLRPYGIRQSITIRKST
jgi:hypothetical protein